MQQFEDASGFDQVNPLETDLEAFAIGHQVVGQATTIQTFHLDGVPTGGLENWRDGQGWETWRHDGGRTLTPAERDVCVQVAKTAKAVRYEEVRQGQALARHAAARIWAASRPAPPDHLYLTRKNVDPHGLRVFKDVLVVPVQDLAGQLHSLQFISAGGAKRFLKGGRIQGLCSWIGEPPDPTGGDSTRICLAEGFATGASLHQAAGHPVVIAFHAGNLTPVALALRARFPIARIIVCADDDHHTPGNPGLTQAQEAARKVNGCVAVPDFGADRPEDARLTEIGSETRSRDDGRSDRGPGKTKTDAINTRFCKSFRHIADPPAFAIKTTNTYAYCLNCGGAYQIIAAILAAPV